MAALSIPHYEPWVFARWAFRMLLERTATHVTASEDKYACAQAVALDGLNFGLKEPDQARRLARAMATAADELRAELMAGPQDDPRDGTFAEKLGEISLQLYDLHHG